MDTTPDHPAPPGTILVVDDTRTSRELAVAYLEEAGYRVLQAGSGEQAIELFSREPADFVLLDIVMPGIDGFQTCRRLRQLPGGDATPIVFLTGSDEESAYERSLDSGADDFLSKPINEIELLLRVRSLVRIKSLMVDLRRSEALIRAQHDRLQQVQQQKDDLTGLIVHDLKNPLTTVLGLVDVLLLTPALPERAGRDLRLIHRAALQMHRMVLNILDIGLSEDGALTPRFSRVALEPLAEGVAAVTAPDESRRARVTNASSHQSIVTDEDLLRRVLTNLVDNSLKYSPKGLPVDIEIRDAVAGQVEILVRDCGPGVPAGQRERIFEKYARLDLHDATEARTSRGLGLAFCKLAVEVLGGRIWVDDAFPRGSVFHVSLPVAR